jgi:outer membrane protein assembly factor BamB
VIDNPNSAVVWEYAGYDSNGNGQLDIEETMHRTMGTVAIADDLLFVADFAGLFHCVNVKTGRPHWVYDMLAGAWGSPLITDNHVYIGDEDGEVAVFRLTSQPHEPVSEIYMHSCVYSTPITANGVLYITNRTHLFAIAEDTP